MRTRALISTIIKEEVVPSCRVRAGAKQVQRVCRNPVKGAKKGNATIEWSEQIENSFRESKHALADATMLAHPIPGAPVSLAVDASDYAIGTVLQQRVNDKCQPLGFVTKS